MLLVPLSKMNVRVFLSADVDLPFTVMPVEVNCHASSWGSMRLPYTMLPETELCELEIKLCSVERRLPVNLVVSMPPRVISALPTAFGVRKRLNREGSP